jgi:hypothetical protein
LGVGTAGQASLSGIHNQLMVHYQAFTISLWFLILCASQLPNNIYPSMITVPNFNFVELLVLKGEPWRSGKAIAL